MGITKRRLSQNSHNEPLYKSPGIFKVVFADFVTSGEGTGFVHTAPGHGPDDFLLAKKLDMH